MTSSISKIASEKDEPPQKSRTKRVRTEAQLARKREIDRRCQSQIRHSNKRRLDMVEQAVAELQENLSRLSEPFDYTQNTNGQSPLSAEILRMCLEKAPTGRTMTVPMLQSQCSVQNSAASVHSTVQRAVSEKSDVLEHEPRASLSYHAPSVLFTGDSYQCRPPPSSLSAGLNLATLCNSTAPSVTDTVKAAKCFETGAFNILSQAHLNLMKDYRSEQCLPRNPSLANMLLVDIDSNAVVQAISCSFRHCSPLDVPDAMATYFIMYRLLRWRVHPDPESYEDVPSWYRPSGLQETTPHNLSYDFWAWPQLRDTLLLRNYIYCEAKFNADMCANITVGWPGGKPLVIKTSFDSPLQVNPEFEAHVMQYENWKVKKAWTEIYPELVGFVNVANE